MGRSLRSGQAWTPELLAVGGESRGDAPSRDHLDWKESVVRRQVAAHWRVCSVYDQPEPSGRLDGQMAERLDGEETDAACDCQSQRGNREDDVGRVLGALIGPSRSNPADRC